MRRTVRLYLALVATFYLAQVLGGPYGAVDLLVIEPLLAVLGAAVVTPFAAYGLRRADAASARAAAGLVTGDDVVADCAVRSRPAGAAWTRWRSGLLHVTAEAVRCDRRLRGGAFLRVGRADVVAVTTREVAARETFWVNAACRVVVLSLANGSTVEVGVLPPVADAFARTVAVVP